jgi:hypothetical protein
MLEFDRDCCAGGRGLRLKPILRVEFYFSEIFLFFLVFTPCFSGVVSILGSRYLRSSGVVSEVSEGGLEIRVEVGCCNSRVVADSSLFRSIVAREVFGTRVRFGRLRLGLVLMRR